MTDVSTVSMPTSRQYPFKPELKLYCYGRQDFHRFPQKAAKGPGLCVALGAIGKVKIEYKYHWKKAQRGLIGQNPAGIVYIDIAIE